MKVGTTCYPHVHWSTDGTSTNNVTWQVTYTTAKGHNQAGGAFGADTVITLTEAASGTAWQHMITEDATGFVVPEVDALTVMEIKRVANTTISPAPSAENADQVFGLFVDVHHEVGPHFGTAQRIPPFYG